MENNSPKITPAEAEAILREMQTCVVSSGGECCRPEDAWEVCPAVGSPLRNGCWERCPLWDKLLGTAR